MLYLTKDLASRLALVLVRFDTRSFNDVDTTRLVYPHEILILSSTV